MSEDKQKNSERSFLSHLKVLFLKTFKSIDEMTGTKLFTETEWNEFRPHYKELMAATSGIVSNDECKQLKETIKNAIGQGHYGRDHKDINTLLRNINTALILCEKIGQERSMLISLLIYPLIVSEYMTIEEAEKLYGADISKLIRGLIKASSLYDKQAAIGNENFKKLLLTFAEDIRVIFIMIADRLCLMRLINHHPDEDFRRDVATEVSYLYAPLAHRLGLYKIKSELEDLSLKYSDREMYNLIAQKLNATKKYRDEYIAAFIEPVKKKLEDEGFAFEIKGRTKSIYSIWNKMKKQHIGVEGIYDLFAVRVILDSPLDKEKDECWRVFSIITNMYLPNPARMKDWLSIPKSNGYESLHTTVLGPEKKWVEVQIRTKRMDEIAERGLAAHWKYKGIKSENNLDEMMNSVREILESEGNGPLEMIKDFRMDIYDKEVFVFSPKGDLYKLPYGSTLLDFAFLIHSKLGCACMGGRVNGKNQTIKYVLKSGDTIEILTSSNQRPKQDWLNIAFSSKTRTKIKQALKEIENKSAELGKELLSRRFKNRKIEVDEGTMTRLIKKMGYKTATDFYVQLGEDKIEANEIIERYLDLSERENQENTEQRSAEAYTLSAATDENKADELVIGGDIKGVDYKLSKCCNPIYGDEIFGFVSTEGTIKIHRKDCPNAAHIRERYGYRIISARWSGKMGTKYATTLRVVGNDDIGIVTNISSIINKEKNVFLRSISIDSNDGLFQGHITVAIDDLSALNALIKKLKTVKGVKDVQRGAI